MSFERGMRGDAGAAVDGGGGHMFVAGLAGFPQLSSLEPGPAAIAYLHSLNLQELTADDRVAVLQAWEANAAWLSAATQPVLTAVAGAAPSDVNDHDWGACEVAAALRLSDRTADVRVHAARTLTGKLTPTLAALESGVISLRHAMVLVNETTGLPDVVIRAVEAKVLPRAAQQTVAQFGRAVRKALMAARPEDAELARDCAKADRRVWVQPEAGGMATLGALLPAEQAMAMYRTVDDLAQHSKGAVDEQGTPLTVDQRRADALAVALLGERPRAGADRSASEDAAGPVAPSPRVPVELQVVVDLPTLLGLADNPVDLPGYGPIPAGIGRELAQDATWRRLITEPRTGHLLDYGRRTYRPPKPLVDFVRARDRRCRFVGCYQSAERCDVDHGLPYAKGGKTCPTNCACLCRRHHRLKTHGGWQLDIAGDGRYIWTSPTGRRYETLPYAYCDTS